MKYTANLKLALYEGSDKMSVTADENSLNSNMKKIDAAVNETKDDISQFESRLSESITEISNIMDLDTAKSTSSFYHAGGWARHSVLSNIHLKSNAEYTITCELVAINGYTYVYAYANGVEVLASSVGTIPFSLTYTPTDDVENFEVKIASADSAVAEGTMTVYRTNTNNVIDRITSDISAIESSNVKLHTTIENGLFINYNGERGGDSVSAITDFIKVEPLSIIAINDCYLKGNRSICGYDNKENFVTRLAGNSAEKSVVLSIPSTVSKIRITSKRGVIPSISYKSIVLPKTVTRYDYNIFNYDKQCVVSFLNDDGNRGQFTDLYPIMSEMNCPYGQAIYTGQYDKLTVDDMRALINLGGDIASHTVTHCHLMEKTEEEIETELRESKAYFDSVGIPCEYIAYPHGESNTLVRKIAKKYYKFGVSTEEKLNDYPIEDFAIKRITLGAFAPSGKNTLEYYKSCVDQALENRQWLIFMLHSNNTEFDDTQKGYLRQTIAHIRSLGIPIMSPTNAYKLFGNPIIIGDNSTGTQGRNSFIPHIVVSKWGDISTKDIRISDISDILNLIE